MTLRKNINSCGIVWRNCIFTHFRRRSGSIPTALIIDNGRMKENRSVRARIFVANRQKHRLLSGNFHCGCLAFGKLKLDINRGANRDNSPLSERIAHGFDITVLLVTERILVVFVKEAKVL